MTGSLLVLVLLGQDAPLAPPPVPPQVAPEDPRPPAAPDESLEGVVEPAPDGDGDEGPGVSTRLLGAIGFAVIAGAATTGAWYFVSTCQGNFSTNGPNCFLGGLAASVLGAGGIVAGAFGGHRLFGGKGGLGWAILGAVAGAVTGFAGHWVFLNTTGNQRAPDWMYVLSTTVLGVVGAGTMLEIGQGLAARERDTAEITVAPVLLRDGAALALSGTF